MPEAQTRSPEERGSRVQARIRDFLEMSVSYILVLDPHEKTAFIDMSAGGLRQVKDGILRTPNPTFEVSLSEFFS